MKITTMQLQTLSNLFSEREREIKHHIGNLSLQEVKEDNAFKATLNRIYKQFLLEPVTIGEPKISSHHQITRKVGPNYQMVFGGEITLNVITVEFPFTGSNELFEYRASGSTLALDTIYTPSYNSIQVEVELQNLDKNEAISKARAEMETTFELIKQNNPSAEHWSDSIKGLIESYATNKRKELLDFYS